MSQNSGRATSARQKYAEKPSSTPVLDSMISLQRSKKDMSHLFEREDADKSLYKSKDFHTAAEKTTEGGTKPTELLDTLKSPVEGSAQRATLLQRLDKMEAER